MTEPFRFLHASDLHLERPPRGLTEVPDHLRSALADAPYRAAERIFDAAIKERVDFVLLCGDIVDPLASGPRGVAFLTEQFERLEALGISVYWAGGRGDDFERWLDLWPVPDNVHRFPMHRIECVLHRRDGDPIVRILGISTQQRKKIRAADFQGEAELFSIAQAHGSVEADALMRAGVEYWALGGEHDRRSPVTGPITAHYPGTPQGRRPQETGPRGCSLVQVDDARRIRVSFLPTESLRYQQERIVVAEATTGEQLYQILNQRAGEWLADPFGPELLVQWTVEGCPALEAELRRGKLANDMATRLRAEHGQRRPAVWTTSVESASAKTVPESLYDEETVLVEFLRTTRH